MKEKRSKILMLTLGLLVTTSLLMGCGGAPTTPPRLPQGFEQDQVPKANLEGYLYFNQGSPMALSGGPVALPSGLNLDAFSLWFVPPDGKGGRLYASPDVIQGLGLLLSGRAWHQVSDGKVELVLGSGSGTEELKSTITGKAFLPLKEAYPAVWDAMRRLPSQPPKKPVAVGFAKPTDALLGTLQSTVPGADSMQSYASYLKYAALQHVVIGLYTDRPLGLPTGSMSSYFKDNNLEVLVIAKSSYPDFVLSVVLGRLAASQGMKEVKVSSQTFYVAEMQGLQVAFTVFNGYMYLAAADSQSELEALLRSTLLR